MRTREQEVWYQVRDWFREFWNIGAVEHECNSGLLGSGLTLDYIPDAGLADRGSFDHEGKTVHYWFIQCSEGCLELRYEWELPEEVQE